MKFLFCYALYVCSYRGGRTSEEAFQPEKKRVPQHGALTWNDGFIKLIRQ